jgi:hypothetical protein
VIAREHGYDDWRALCAVGDGPGADRWRPSSLNVYDQAVEEAKAHGYTWLGTVHLLMALVRPSTPTVASQALEELGLRYDDMVARLPHPRRTRADDGIMTNPRYQMYVSFATALALAEGVEVTDEHVLLALIYRDDGETLTDFDLDPDEVYDALVRDGVTVPSVRPPVATTPLGPPGPRVYFPGEDFGAVVDALAEQSGSTHWGWNVSQWRPGQYWIDSEDEIDAAVIVRAAVSDPRLVDVVSHEIAMSSELEALERGDR